MGDINQLLEATNITRGFIAIIADIVYIYIPLLTVVNYNNYIWFMASSKPKYQRASRHAPGGT
jgi:hypothetical protein